MSTTHALLEAITSAIDNNKYCAGVFVDLKNAFDTVNRDLLVSKLNGYGIRRIAILLLLSRDII